MTLRIAGRQNLARYYSGALGEQKHYANAIIEVARDYGIELVLTRVRRENYQTVEPFNKLYINNDELLVCVYDRLVEKIKNNQGIKLLIETAEKTAPNTVHVEAGVRTPLS